MTSSSSLGSTSITLQFDLNRDINAAARDVQAAINAARGQLPADLPQKPSYRKINPADPPIMIIALTSDTLPRPDIRRGGFDPRAKAGPDAGRRTGDCGRKGAAGGARGANPTELNSYGISLEEVRTALGNANANRPKGELCEQHGKVAVQ